MKDIILTITKEMVDTHAFMAGAPCPIEVELRKKFPDVERIMAGVHYARIGTTGFDIIPRFSMHEYKRIKRTGESLTLTLKAKNHEAVTRIL